MDWTSDTIATLKALWSEGHSTAEIGRRLGCSKNAACGKVHRIGLPARPSPINDTKTFDYDEARRLRAIGHTYAEIGEKLGISADTASWAARDGLRIARGVALPKLASEVVRVPVKVVSSGPVVIPATMTSGERIYTRRRTCEAVTSNGRPWTFCAEDAAKGSYCAAHAELYLIDPKRRRPIEADRAPMVNPSQQRAFG
ncbi:MAG: hypothetical protein NTX56_04310 [Proteobacteria bacterium]|nr:hypothetical protein [Pseudomonadota bacterium]